MQKPSAMGRRAFLKGGLAAAGAVLAAPMIVPGSALGADGAVAPSDRINLGAIGIGSRGGYDLGCFLNEPDIRFVAICDVRRGRREAVKKMADDKYKNNECRMYRDFRELLAQKDIDAVLIATGPNWHATASMYAAKAGKDVYCEKPSTKNIVQSIQLAETFRRTGRVFQGGMQRRNLPHFIYAIDLARHGKLGKLHTLYAHPCGMGTGMSGWHGTPAPEPNKEDEDWDLWLGPAAWRPYTKGAMGSAFGFEKGGGLIGGGVLEWGSHCIDLCQWANDCNYAEPIEYFPIENNQAKSIYPNGVKLICRERDWLSGETCPVRFEGETGWVETGDSGNIVASHPSLLANWGAKRVGGYPANNHIRDFLDCVKTRGQPKANADVACHSHIACHAIGTALFLKRKLTYDPKTYMFVNDDEANRLRSEALREPWRL